MRVMDVFGQYPDRQYSLRRRDLMRSSDYWERKFVATVGPAYYYYSHFVVETQGEVFTRIWGVHSNEAPALEAEIHLVYARDEDILPSGVIVL